MKGKINLKVGIPKFSFIMALIGLSLGTKSNPIVIYVLVGVVALDGIILVFEKTSSKLFWNTIVDAARVMDFTYLSFGIGMVNLGKKILTPSFSWVGILLLLGGASFAYLNVAELIGKGSKSVLVYSKKKAVILGLLMSVGGAIWLGFSWSIANLSILSRINNVVVQILIVGIGIILVYLGRRKPRISLRCESNYYVS